MKVELWEDVICSWCGVTNGRVAAALEEFGHAEEVEFTHRSFRMMSTLPEGQGVPFVEHMKAQGGMPIEQMRAMVERVEKIAHQDGIEEYHVLDNTLGNTNLAHEFLAWASAQGKQNEAWELLFHAHFSEKADLWTIEDLVPFAERLGLDPSEARAALEARTYREQVIADHNEVLALGARGVPFLVIDGRYGVSGAHSVNDYVRALETAWASREEVPA